MCQMEDEGVIQALTVGYSNTQMHCGWKADSWDMQKLTDSIVQFEKWKLVLSKFVENVLNS